MGLKNKSTVVSFSGDRKILLASGIMPMESVQGLNHQKWHAHPFLILRTSVSYSSVCSCFLTLAREAHSLCHAWKFSALLNVRFRSFFFVNFPSLNPEHSGTQ